MRGVEASTLVKTNCFMLFAQDIVGSYSKFSESPLSTHTLAGKSEKEKFDSFTARFVPVASEVSPEELKVTEYWCSHWAVSLIIPFIVIWAGLFMPV